MALRVHVDLDYCILNCCAASLPERWLSFVSLDVMQRVRSLLKQLREMLQTAGEHHFVEMIDAALAGDNSALQSFLTSNELCGGAGSIADQALGPSRKTRRPLEHLLAELGHEQIAVGRTNPRTEMWTSVFEQWHAQNI
jgi:hypothetical protein